MYKKWLSKTSSYSQNQRDLSSVFITLKGKAITTGLAYETGLTWILGASVSSWANNFPSTGRKTIGDYDVCNSVGKCKLVNSSKNESRYFWDHILFYANRPSFHTKPVNPRTESTYFWNRFPEWILDPMGLVPDINYAINSGHPYLLLISKCISQ